MRVSQVALSLVALLVAAVSMASGLDRLSDGTPGLERLVPGPFRAEADRAAAITQLARQQVGPALVFARDAVRRDPIDPDSTPLLGEALLLSQDFQGADETFRIAARYGWRNLETQTFWYDAAFAVKDYEVAADRVDAILRTRPRLAADPSILERMEAEPAAQKALAHRLESKPAWLETYLRLPVDADPQLFERRYAIVSQIDVSRLKIGCEMIAPFSRTLLGNGRRDDALELWNRHCPENKAGAVLGDRLFARAHLGADPGYPFVWRAFPSGDVSFRPQDGAGEDAGLEVTNSASVSRLILSQSVAFPPGKYRIKVDAQGAAGNRSGAISLSWSCNGRPTFSRLPQGDPLAGGQVLSVGPCDRQQLGLWLAGDGSSVTLRSIRFEKVG